MGAMSAHAITIKVKAYVKGECDLCADAADVDVGRSEVPDAVGARHVELGGADEVQVDDFFALDLGRVLIEVNGEVGDDLGHLGFAQPRFHEGVAASFDARLDVAAAWL